MKGIQSEAYRKAQEVMGKADGEATRIYAEAYGRDPALYEFLKTMETYRSTFRPTPRSSCRPTASSSSS